MPLVPHIIPEGVWGGGLTRGSLLVEAYSWNNKLMPAPKKLTDKQILDAWVNNPDLGVTKIARILGIRYESLTYRLDKLIGLEQRKARGTRLVGTSTNKVRKPGKGSRDWMNRAIVGKEAAHIHNHKPKRWFGETDEHFKNRIALLETQVTGEDHQRIQQQLRAQSRIAQRALGDPDAPSMSQ